MLSKRSTALALFSGQFWLLITWVGVVVGVGISGTRGSLLSIALIAMPAIGTLPIVCRYLFRRMPPLIGAIIVSATAALCAAMSWRQGNIAGPQAIVMATPLYQLSVVAGGYKVFVGILGREPTDVIFNFNAGLGWDRIFAFFTFLLALLVPANVLWAILG